MKFRVFILVAIAGLVGLGFVLLPNPQHTALAHTRITTDVTWSENIREIFRRKCMTCHHPGGIAPDYVDFTVYGTDTKPGARAWAIAIEEEIMTGRMPPWNADARFSRFANAKQLTDEEREYVLAWIAGGAPQGPYRNIPVPEEFTKPTWNFGEPDLVVSMPEPHIVPADQIQDTYTVRIPMSIDEDAWITGYEFLPGDPKNILAISAYLHDPEGFEPEPLELEVQEEYDPFADEDAPEPTRLRAMPEGPHFLGQWARGDAPVLFPDAAARLLRVGSTLELHIEYRRPEFADWSSDITDRTQLGLFLADEDEEIDLLVESKAVSNTEFIIGANESHYEVRAELTLDENVHLIGLNPRMGVLGSDLEVRLTYPDGKPITLLWVPEYESKWTTSYQFDRPVAAPANSRIELIAHYDNTSDNWNNPNDPPQDVSAGTGFEDERLFAMIDYMLDDHLNVEEERVPAEDAELARRGGMSLGGAFPLPDEPEEPTVLDPKDFGLEEILQQAEKDIYWCPMRGTCELKDYHGPGTCDECFMDLRPKESFFEGMEESPDATDWVLRPTGAESIYWCPNRGRSDHELKDYSEQGRCEVCDESLLHRERFEIVHTYTCLTTTCDRYTDVFYGPGLCPECGQPVVGMGHMDHEPVHGGWQFFMADNLYHHLEGTMPSPGEFKLYFYDDWKNPLDARNFSGRLYIEQENESTGEVTEKEIALEQTRPGDTFFTASVGTELPVAFYTKIMLGGVEKRYDFEFDELTEEPTGDEASKIRLHTHKRELLDIPDDPQEIALAIFERDRILNQRIGEQDWLGLHNPAFDAKDFVAALEQYQQGLGVRQRGALKKAVGLINRGGNGLDRAGDASDPPRVRKAYETFSEGIALLKTLYPRD